MMKISHFRSFFAALWLGSVVSAFAAADRPNIVFILCDDLGVNDLACYGRTDHHTPNLDRLATEGVGFTSAYCAQPICSPSRAAILIGKTPARLHLTTYLPGRPDAPTQKLLNPVIEKQVPLSEKAMPLYFKEAGYVTAAIGKWHIGGTGYGPKEHGFDVVVTGNPNTTPTATEGSKGEFALTKAAVKFIEDHHERPFLLYLGHFTPHIPFKATPESAGANRTSFDPTYAAVIESMDRTVGLLLAKLDALHLTENTIVIFTSDNGGLHVPEGGHAQVTHNTPFRAGKGYVYEGGLRIPLIVRWPGRIPAGKTIAEPVINTGWIATLLDLAGVKASTPADGQSFAALLKGTASGAGNDRTFFWHFPHYNNQGGRPAGAVRKGNWKLVEYYDAPDAPELYDLSTDVGERHNLASQHPDRVHTMQAALEVWLREIDAQRNVPNPNFNPAKFRELYVDFDPSAFDPLHATAQDWAAVATWRSRMNAAVARPAEAAAARKKQ